jgi:gliding motility-associated-like protein
MKKLYFLFLLIFPFSNGFSQGSDCSNAIFVASNGCSAVGQYNNTGITGTLSNPSCFTTGTNNGMWFQFIAATPVANVTINGSTLTQVQASLLAPPTGGCTGGTFTELTCGTSVTTSVTLTYSALVVGNTYYIYVDGTNSLTGTFQVCVSSPAQPNNDNPCTPFVVPANAFCSSLGAYTNVGATEDNLFSASYPGCWSAGTFNTVYFQFTALGAYNTISVTGGTNGLQTPQVAVINTTDCSGSAWSSSNCAAAASGNTVTLNANNLTPGQTYLVAIDGGTNNVGSFQLCVNSYTPSNVPPNDLCSNATFLCPNGYYTSTTLNATGTGDIPVANWVCNGVLDNTVWFQFVASNPVQPVVFNLNGTCTAPYLQFEVFNYTGTGSACANSGTNNWTSIACNNAIGASGSATVTVPAANMVAGTTYYVIVDNWPGESCNFDFSVSGNAGANAGSDIQVCASDAPVTLSGTPTGGTWSGPGVTNGIFNPATVGTGNYSIYYTFGTCVDEKIITVAGVDVVVSNDISICQGDTVNLLGSINPFPTTYPVSFSNTTDFAIPDNLPAGVSSTVNVTGITPTTIGTNPISTVCVNIAHINDQHLDIFLICPDGTQIELSTDNGAAGDNYTQTCFTPNVTNLITTGTAPFTGYFAPEQSFSLQNACNVNGTWTLLVVDDQGGTAGTLLDWTITFNTDVVTTYSWSPTTSMTNSTALNPFVNPTSTTTYTLTSTGLNGCSNTDQVTVNVSNCGCTITASNSGSVCPGATINLTASEVIGATYSWNGPSGYTSTLQNPTSFTAPTIPGQYSYTVSAQLPSGDNCASTTQYTVFSPIQVNAGSDAAICIGASTTLNATGTPTINWTGGYTNGQSVSPTSTTTYTVNGTDANGCTSTDQVTITVNPLPVINAGSDAAVCIGGSSSLTASGGTTYTWNASPDLTTTAGATTTATPATTSNYTVTGVDANGCQNTDQVTVIVNPLPTISAGLDVSICNGQSTTLTASGGSTYVWTPSTGLSSTTTTSVTANPSATTTYTVNGTDINGCSNTDDVIVTVNPNIPVNAGLDTSICPGGTAVLTASPLNTFTTVVWNNNVQDGVGFNPASTTTYTVTGTSSNGCVTTDQVIVTILTPPIVSAGSDQTICPETPVILSGSGATTYSWDNNVQNGISFSPNNTVTYTVTGTDINGCVGSDQVIVTVLPPPISDFTASPLSGSIPLNVTCVNNSSNASNYTWNFGNSDVQSTNDLSNVSTIYTVDGIYTIMLVASNGLCDDTSYVTIEALPLPPLEVEVPNVFTPNADGNNEGYYVWTKNAASIEAVIVNRWGNTMVVIDDLTYQWDGKTPDGKEATAGVYFLKYKVKGLDGTEVSGHTFFHLIR